MMAEGCKAKALESVLTASAESMVLLLEFADREGVCVECAVRSMMIGMHMAIRIETTAPSSEVMRKAMDFVAGHADAVAAKSKAMRQ